MYGRLLRIGLALAAFLVVGGVYLALGGATAEASPADPSLVKEFDQPDGTIIELRVWGDEFTGGWETLDGYAVVENTSTGYLEYAVADSAGNLVPSGVMVGEGSPPAPPHLRPSEKVINDARADLGAPPLGVPRSATPPPWAGSDTDLLFIMVDFTDVACTFTAAQMQNNLFGGGASGPGDLDDYYDEISYGALDLDGTVVGCFHLANTHTHYDQGPGSAVTAVAEAVALADPSVNFADFDNDGDTVVDALGVIYAGGGPHDGCETDDGPPGGDGDDLWPHSWDTGGTATADGVTVNHYIIQSEVTHGVNPPTGCTQAQTIGLFAHEFGHALGLPDLYDTDGSSHGVGSWSTMASQFRSTVNLADTPPHFDPWSKWHQGWITPTDLTGMDVARNMPQVETTPSVVQLLSNPGGVDWARGSPGTGEYFLIENRQYVGFDSQLPGCGLLVWHIEESRSNNTNEGHTTASHRLVDLEEADGLDDLDQNPLIGGNRGDTGDPYPGSANNTLFADTTYPTSDLYDGSASAVRMQVVGTACAANMQVNFGNPQPVADANGPYVTNEGTDVPLDGTGSSDPQGDPLTYEWDLDNDGAFDDATGPTPTFDMVGQDGVFTIRLRVTDPGGAFDVDETTVTVNNVAPSVSLASDAPKDEGSPVTVSGTVTDPGWLDPLSGTIDWGDGTPVEPVGGVLENVRPDATLIFSVSHVYGDNGVFTAQVCASDDDTTTCESIALQINNVDPTAEIDESGAVLVHGIPTFIAHAGESLDFSGRSTDPGSDDLLLTWDLGNGSPIASTMYLANPPNPDPFPSPSIQPRDVTDTQAHTYANACLYQVRFWAEDDDGGISPVDSANVVIVGNADQVRSAGYWQDQFRSHLTGRGHSDFDRATLECYLAITGYMSEVFDEERNASTFELAHGVLRVNQNGGNMMQQFDRQLLAAWLNFANGSIEYDEMVDTNGDGIADIVFLDAVSVAEAVRLDPNATRAQLEEQKNILGRINLMDM